MKKLNRTTGASPAAGTQNPAALECRFCGHPCQVGLEELPCQKCGSDVLFRSLPPGTPRNYREIVDSLGLKDRDIARAFKYLNLGAFTSSTAANRIRAGVEFVYYQTLFSLLEAAERK